ncbi:hypothetical protein BHE74_00036262 [Ensete ventricosum]|nr:hypothetical protein BHE74_00036262 [Ensete ventricosum]
MDIRAYPNLYPKRAVGLRPRSTWLTTCVRAPKVNDPKTDSDSYPRSTLAVGLATSAWAPSARLCKGNKVRVDDRLRRTMGTLGRAIYTVGYWIRGTGQAIDRLACRLQGNYLFQEQRNLCPHNVDSLAHAYILNINLTGHSAVLHGCIVEDEAFVGMGAVLLDGVVVEKHGMVAGGALVRHNTKIPSGEVPPPHFCFIKLLVFFIEYATSNYPATAIILLICCLNLSLS